MTVSYFTRFECDRCGRSEERYEDLPRPSDWFEVWPAPVTFYGDRVPARQEWPVPELVCADCVSPAETEEAERARTAAKAQSERTE